MIAATLLEHWMPDSFAEFVWLVIDAIVCMGTAVICGYIVGHDRQKARATVGVRTHVLVCVGAAGFVHLGMIAGLRYGLPLDFARLIQSIATGIGFLGAGAIFKGGAGVRGLSTATSIWLMGAAGTAAGCGAVAFALLIAVIAYFLLRWSGEPVEIDELWDDIRERFFDDVRDRILGRPPAGEPGAAAAPPTPSGDAGGRVAERPPPQD